MTTATTIRARLLDEHGIITDSDDIADLQATWERAQAEMRREVDAEARAAGLLAATDLMSATGDDLRALARMIGIDDPRRAIGDARR